jgi:cysteinyl-tRNA synthetase
MPTLKLHNSLSGAKEIFQPIDPTHIRVYACGPTVYNYAHIGNARMAVAFDQLVRVLRSLYPKVTYASNITDVDDKIMNAAKETGQSIDSITTKFARIYNEDMAALGVLPPDVQPYATGHIPDMIILIEKLIARGHAYAAEGHALFHVPSFPAYGSLSRRSRDDQIAGARVEISPFKKDPADFVLWKPSTPDQPGWESPWGRGRPGWHIECSAMTERHLGLPFDIHGGGADLKFPHHENEIAQSCCAHGHADDLRAFAKYWIHNGFVTVEGEKMSKSLGNFIVTHDLLGEQPGEVLRLALLSAHYRQPLDWTRHGVEQARKYLDRLYHILHNAKDVPADESASVPDKVMSALCDDLNTPMALAAINELTHEEKDKARLKGALLKTGELLGILREDPAAWLGYDAASAGIDAMAVESLLLERQNAKKEKDFARADEIRKNLEAQGIAIEDTAAGPKWRKIL